MQAPVKMCCIDTCRLGFALPFVGPIRLEQERLSQLQRLHLLNNKCSTDVSLDGVDYDSMA